MSMPGSLDSLVLFFQLEQRQLVVTMTAPAPVLDGFWISLAVLDDYPKAVLDAHLNVAEVLHVYLNVAQVLDAHLNVAQVLDAHPSFGALNAGNKPIKKTKQLTKQGKQSN